MGESAEMNLSIESNKDFIRGDHPVSATMALLVSHAGEHNCVVLIWKAISKQRHSISSPSPPLPLSSLSHSLWFVWANLLK